MDRIKRLTALGQSIWMDNIQRRLLENGETKSLIERGDIRGMTSNPTIFNHAIANAHDYDEALRALAWAGWDSEKIFWELVIEDIRKATDLFSGLYEQTNGGDGYVSIEVSPFLANDTAATLAQAEQLWARVARPNLMVKIPATPAGIPAIRQAVAAGLNINITLIFSRERYAEVMEAYLAGLEQRLESGQAIGQIASVASFFVSRVDTKVDGQLPEGSPLRGRAAIANAKLAYQDFLAEFSGPRWESIRSRGGRVQRPLWASTSTKNPAYADTMYVDNLIGPDTINTVPPQTLDAARDHARTAITITEGVDEAKRVLAELEAAGISMAQVTADLEIEGVKAFSESISALLTTIDKRREAAVGALGPLATSVAATISRLEAESLPRRLWAGDASLWAQDQAGQAEVRRRLGWLESPQQARSMLSAYEEFATSIRNQGIHRVLVLGMGGSSLTAEVLSSLFRNDPSKVPFKGRDAEVTCLAILDSTDPQQVAKAAEDFPPEHSLYIVASKSGGTTEVSACFEYFWELSGGNGSRFVAITDKGTSLEQLARDHHFRRVFAADANVGGRYSALTDFGMVPGALLGVALDRLLDQAEWMQAQCDADEPAARNPGIALGAFLAEGAMAGRDKLTLVADEPVQALASWIEQLVAESSGKLGKGIIPIVLEPLDAPAVYGRDRLFVYLRADGSLDTGVEALKQAGFPVLVLSIETPYAAGAEFFRWEVAIATACHILGVNAFDQPDVQDSKDRTKAKLQEFKGVKALPEGDWDVEIPSGSSAIAGSDALLEFLDQVRPGDYIGINAYVPRDVVRVRDLQRLRVRIREQHKVPAMVGFGPRFQHSTGQLHKGGPGTGSFIQIVSNAEKDIWIPGEGMTFGTLIRAQALGDFEALRARGRRVLRVRLDRPEQLSRLVEVLS